MITLILTSGCIDPSNIALPENVTINIDVPENFTIPKTVTDALTQQCPICSDCICPVYPTCKICEECPEIDTWTCYEEGELLSYQGLCSCTEVYEIHRKGYIKGQHACPNFGESVGRQDYNTFACMKKCLEHEGEYNSNLEPDASYEEVFDLGFRLGEMWNFCEFCNDYDISGVCSEEEKTRCAEFEYCTDMCY